MSIKVKNRGGGVKKSFPNGTEWTQSNITSGNFNPIYNANGIWVTGSYGAGLYYSTDGNDPVIDAAHKYADAISVTATTTIKAVAVENGKIVMGIVPDGEMKVLIKDDSAIQEK